MSANADFFDAQMRHQIGVQRVSAGNVQRILRILDRSTKELNAKLRARGLPNSVTTKRYKELAKDIRALRKQIFKELLATNRSDLKALAKAEQEFARRMLENSIPVRLDFATAEIARLNALVTENPFTAGTNAARSLTQWWNGLATADGNRIIDALQLGIVQNETIGQITSRVTTATNMTRANAEAVVRTGVNHASNVARNEFFKANKEVVPALMWSAMLDGRTTIQCASRDGYYAPSDGGDWTGVPEPHLGDPLERPPIHVQCRSYMVGVLSSKGIAEQMGNRPFVRDARTRRMREKDFRAEAKAEVGAKKWSQMTPKQRTAKISSNRRAWTEQNVGSVPVQTNYDQWLRRQPAAFQNEVLGVAKGRAFRKGLTLDKFLDRRGNELTLTQLSEKFPTYVGDPRGA
jgi:SPP1 gp7 family putative phage head morphogenesis protein